MAGSEPGHDGFWLVARRVNTDRRGGPWRL